MQTSCNIFKQHLWNDCCGIGNGRQKPFTQQLYCRIYKSRKEKKILNRSRDCWSVVCMETCHGNPANAIQWDSHRTLHRLCVFLAHIAVQRSEQKHRKDLRALHFDRSSHKTFAFLIKLRRFDSVCNSSWETAVNVPWFCFHNIRSTDNSAA